ncbi:MAG: hypothetical protein LBD99_01265, partial [Candidatus Margulisbacteria bacterium]|nr:hypothetical protein [Candidatus Margulisiibacteriota bacterium]
IKKGEVIFMGLEENANKMAINNIAKDGYVAVGNVGAQRAAIMEAVKSAAVGSGGTTLSISATASYASQSVNVGSIAKSLHGVDIATGAGALVLDDALQELSTIEQAAAQLVAAENKAQKQVHSVTGQG